MLVDLVEEEVGVDLRLEGKEGLSEARREGGGWLLDSLLSSCDLGSVARIEVVDGLLWGQLGNGGKH